MRTGYQPQGWKFKFERAKSHLEELRAKVNDFVEGESLKVFEEVDAASGDRLYRVKITDNPPPLLAVIVGDALHNLRSALDHLVWQLWIVNGQTPNRRVEFPIFLRADDYKKGAETRIGGVDPSARDVIEDVQPFKRPKPEDHDLWKLHELNNQDKHRLLNFFTGALALEQPLKLGKSGVPFLLQGKTFPPHVFQRLEDGAELTRIPQGVDIRFDFRFDIAFADPDSPARRNQVIPTLDRITQTVDEILSKLCPFLREGAEKDVRKPDQPGFQR